VQGRVTGKIGPGFLILAGFAPADTEAQLAWMADKILGLRVFGDAEGKMNRDLAETGGGVLVSWRVNGNNLELLIEDEGAGLSNTSNLFVPFFTTKPGGSGIGLALSRQIAEGHGGVLTLENRSTGKGCEARLRLPV